ncbi:MAG TPA: transcriptional repressor LexA [Alphaproteobacteria bacterium]
MLTPKQQQLFDFIDKKVTETGVSPSFDEMREAVGLKSKSGIHRLVQSLSERGFVRQLKNKARALEVVRRPVEEALKNIKAPLEDIADMVTSTFNLPVLGKIAAGTPIEAIGAVQSYIPVPVNMLSKHQDYYALTVEGDSMMDAGICDGDQVIIQRTTRANNGDIVVALVDRAEATLKRMYQQGGVVELRPENTAYNVQRYSTDRVEIQGVLAGLMRWY